MLVTGRLAAKRKAGNASCAADNSPRVPAGGGQSVTNRWSNADIA
jgi:hypothetical protein